MDYVSIAISIFVAVALFIISYRQTIGAKKERVNSTYNEIVKILVRNLVNIDYVPTIPEINRLLRAKSIENKISITDLPDEMTFIYAIYARVSEDEILSSDKKKELINKINDCLEKIEEKAPSIIEEEKEPIDIKPTEVEAKKDISLLFFFALIAGIFINFITEFLFTKTISIDILISILGVIAGITAILGAIVNFIKFKEKQEEPKASRKSVIEEGRTFEDEIFKIIKDIGEIKREVRLRKDDIIRMFDFSFKREDKTFLIEVKMFRFYVPLQIIHSLNNRAKFAKERDKNSVLILVVNNKKYLARHLDELSKTWDHVFDEKELREFRNELVHKAK